MKPSSSTSCAVGIDVGGTKIAAGVVLLPEGEVRFRQQRPTDPGRGGELLLGDVLGLVGTLVAEAAGGGLTPQAVGIGVPELVDSHGSIVSNHTLGWETECVRERFADLLPCVMESDVRAAALAEAHLGAGKGMTSFVYVTVGTGISSCLVIDGRPFAGSRGLTGTMASSPVLFPDTSGRMVTGPPLEKYAAGPAVVERFNALQSQQVEKGEEVIALAASGNPAALEVIQTAAQALGAAIGHLVNVLDPEAVILGGGLGLSGGVYRDILINIARQHIWSAIHRDLPVLSAKTGLNAGIIGAAMVALQNKPSV